jgi:putative transposase
LGAVSVSVPRAVLFLKCKASNAGAEVNDIATRHARLSQYQHDVNQYIKKSLSQRYTLIEQVPYQRDLYSAYLAMCIDDSFRQVDPKRVEALWCSTRSVLVDALDQTIKAAKSYHLISSLGIGQIRSLSGVELLASQTRA